MRTPRRNRVFPKPVLGISGIQSRIPLGIRNGTDQPPIPETPRYTITLEPVASGRFQAPPIARLKGLIKSAGRAWGLRVVTASEHPAPSSDVEPGRGRPS
jgi:hypothetical protein